MWMLLFSMAVQDGVKQEFNQDYQFEREEACEAFVREIQPEYEIYQIEVECVLVK